MAKDTAVRHSSRSSGNKSKSILFSLNPWCPAQGIKCVYEICCDWRIRILTTQSSIYLLICNQTLLLAFYLKITAQCEIKMHYKKDLTFGDGAHVPFCRLPESEHPCHISEQIIINCLFLTGEWGARPVTQSPAGVGCGFH